ncbi:MAG: PAS domain-containing protein [Clostridia bacterium]|nr:PAS domain-containing protein [Clostridia bacterium]
METNDIYKAISKKTSDIDKIFKAEDLETTSDFYSNVFNTMEEGVSVLGEDLVIKDVNFAMRKWYSGKDKIVGEKCYKVYHNRSEPCEACPVRRTFETGKAQTEIVPYQTGENDEAGWQELKGYPIFDDGHIVGVIEYIKDVTYEVNLFSKVANIERELGNLKTQNDILKTYLGQKELEKNTLENNISLNVKKLVKPLISEMKGHFEESSVETEMISFLESLLEKIVEPFMSNIANAASNFTTREIEIMQMIKQGKPSKEIAGLLFVTEKTVAFHRGNIRKKLGLNRKNDNLRAYLLKKPIIIE